MPSRLGGDEFAIALPGVDEAGASPVLERLRERLAGVAEAGGWPVGFSMGIVAYESAPGDVEGMLAAADQRMYAVKRERNSAVP